MYPIKLQPLGEQVLRSFCKSRKGLYNVIEKNNGFKVKSTNLTWLGRLLGAGQMMELDKQEDNSFDLYLDPNIVYELYINELIELINFIDKIRDKTPEKIDLRLYKDEN